MFEFDVDTVPNGSDFTIYLPVAYFEYFETRLLSQLNRAGSISSPVRVRGANRAVVGRGLLCLCAGRQFVSITVRVNGAPSPSWEIMDSGGGGGGGGLPGVRESLYELLMGGEATGLLVIAGRTKSCKSVISRGLIDQYLNDPNVRALAGRRPHLVSLEDPIEVPYDRFDRLRDDTRRVDFTQRDQTTGDFIELSRGFSDALRQTPAVVYVGEVRRKEDWESVVEFAGTGHLVVVTSHSGSVSETFATIFSAVGATTPSERGFVSKKILGVVHMARLDGFEYPLPAVWRRTERGAACMISDGLSSILPNSPGTPELVAETSSFGRQYFARKLAMSAPQILQATIRDLEGI